MKIKNVSCTQFAGVNNREISFSDGLNVVYGGNESGKSTLVNLISRTLFQNVKLDGRNKDFKNLYFPGQTKGGKVTGDFVDGKITIEAEDGTYTLSKEWGDDPRCTLTTPAGIIRDQDRINGILGQILRYGEGVYSDMLFSSQRNADTALQTLLDASKKTEAKQEILSAVSKAFAESGGASTDVIERRIDEKIGALGKFWDGARNAPVPKAGGGRRTRDCGELVDKYYALEDAKTCLREISGLETALDGAAKLCAEAEAELTTAESEYEKFSKYFGKLAVRKERAQQIARAEADIKKLSRDSADWAEREKKLKTALPLREERFNRELKDKLDGAGKLVDFIARGERFMSGKTCPDEGDISRAERAAQEMPRLENRLRGMNIDAAVELFGGNKIEIISLRTGEPLDCTGGVISITEAVRIRVPGVLEMQLSPADVDVGAVRNQIAAREKILNEIYEKYGVSSVEELKKLGRDMTTAKSNVDVAKERLDMLLGGASYEALRAEAEKISAEPRAKEAIERDVAALCGGGDVEKFITVEETRIGGYRAEYAGADELKNRISAGEAELAEMKKSFEELKDIPEEFLGIANPEQRLKALQDRKKEAQSAYEKSLVNKTNCAANLENFKDSLQSDPAEEAEKAEREFNETKDLLNRWLHIKKVFNELKEDIKNNPLQDVADSFARYLSVISGGRVSTELPDADRLNIEVFSSDRLLDYGKLSEGTKETVSLAFRLAVLDHLFPDGGVIVFDDPFTDMDGERTRQSCALIRECAARHQVIFLTCKEECAELLGSDVIRI